MSSRPVELCGCNLTGRRLAVLRNPSTFSESADATVPFDGMSPLASRHPALSSSRLTTASSDLRGINTRTASRVEISPSAAVERRLMTGRGIVAELVQSTSRDRIEFRYRGAAHLLVAYEQGMRREGE